MRRVQTHSKTPDSQKKQTLLAISRVSNAVAAGWAAAGPTLFD